MDEDLAVALRAGQSALALRDNLEALGADGVDRPGDRVEAGLVVANDPSGTGRFVPADLELGLDEGDEVTAGPSAESDGRSQLPEADEGCVDHGEVDRAPDLPGAESAGVRALPYGDASVNAEPVGELAVTHVDGDDVGGASLEETVGEAPGRSAEIEASQGADVDAEVVERAGELDAPSRDVRVIGRAEVDDRVVRDERARLVDPLPGHADVAREHQRLGARSRRGEAS